MELNLLNSKSIEDFMKEWKNTVALNKGILKNFDTFISQYNEANIAYKAFSNEINSASSKNYRSIFLTGGKYAVITESKGYQKLKEILQELVKKCKTKQLEDTNISKLEKEFKEKKDDMEYKKNIFKKSEKEKKDAKKDKELYNNAKKEYNKSKKNYDEAKKAYDEAKKAYDKAGKESNKQIYIEKRNNIINAAKAALNNKTINISEIDLYRQVEILNNFKKKLGAQAFAVLFSNLSIKYKYNLGNVTNDMEKTNYNKDNVLCRYANYK